MRQHSPQLLFIFIFFLLPLLSEGQTITQDSNSCSGSIQASNLPSYNNWLEVGDGSSGDIKICVTDNQMSQTMCGGGIETVIYMGDGSAGDIDEAQTWEEGNSCYIMDHTNTDGVAYISKNCFDANDEATVSWTTVNSNGVSVCPNNSCSVNSDCPDSVTCSNNLCQYVPTPDCDASDCITNPTSINECGTSFSTKTDSMTGYAYLTKDFDKDGSSDVSWGTVDNSSWYRFCPSNSGTWEVTMDATNCECGDGVQIAGYQGDPTDLHTKFYDDAFIGTGYTKSFSVTDPSNGCVYLVFDGISSNSCPDGDNCDLSVSVTCTDCGCTLPVDLLSFKGKAFQKGNRLKWTTAAEQNNSHFLLQRSKGGKQFQTFKRIEGSGQSSKTTHYKAWDKEPYSGVSYYRLKQVDLDGQEQVYNVIAVDRANASKQAPAIENLYPNPVSGQGIHVDLRAKTMGEASLKVYDRTGELVHETERVLKKGKNHLKINLQGLGQGFYTLRVQPKGRPKAEMLEHFVIDRKD